MLKKEITWNAQSLIHFDPRTKQCELEVQRIIHLQQVANQLLDAFSNPKRITNSHVPTENAHIRINVLEGPFITNESKVRLKRGRLAGSKNKILERKGKQKIIKKMQITWTLE